MGTFRFDPRKMITSPLETCPFCGAAEEFGLLSVHGRGYAKRCRGCMQDESYDLPSVEKRLVYLDQHAISHMAKALHPDWAEKYARDVVRTQYGFWWDLFAKLDRLGKLQLILCPWSEIQRQESLLDDRLTETLRTMYEHLAGGVSYEDPSTIQRFQLLRAFDAWLDGHSPESLSRSTVTHGRLDEWQDKLRVSAHFPITDEERTQLRVVRDAADANMKAIVEEWQAGERREFAEVYDEQREAARSKDRSGWPVSLVSLMMRDRLRQRGISDAEHRDVAMDFFASDTIIDVPFTRLGSALLASLAVLASTGRAAKPTRGMLFDFRAIANYAPYCDAMLIDRECYRLITDSPAIDQFPPGLRLYSVDQRDDLMAYLDGIEHDASAQHHELVERVYGPGWLEPFEAIYTWRDQVGD